MSGLFGGLVPGAGIGAGTSSELTQANAAGELSRAAGVSTPGAGRLALAQGTITTALSPVSITETRNAGAVAFPGLLYDITDTASAAASNFVSLRRGGVGALSVGRAGQVRAADGFYAYLSDFWCHRTVSNTDTTPTATNRAAGFGQNLVGISLCSDWLFSWGPTAFAGSGDIAGARDTALGRNAAGVVEVNSGTLGQLRDIRVRRARTEPVSVASLPTASSAGAGARAFVTDANATTFAAVVAGGGSNGVPVYSDGTDWRIG